MCAASRRARGATKLLNYKLHDLTLPTARFHYNTPPLPYRYYHYYYPYYCIATSTLLPRSTTATSLITEQTQKVMVCSMLLRYSYLIIIMSNLGRTYATWLCPLKHVIILSKTIETCRIWIRSLFQQVRMRRAAGGGSRVGSGRSDRPTRPGVAKAPARLGPTRPTDRLAPRL